MVDDRRTAAKVVVRLRSEERALAVLAIMNMIGYKTVAGIEPEKTEKLGDAQQALQLHPLRGDCTPVSKNDECPCGSGKKFKKCCKENPGRLSARLKTSDRVRLITSIEEAIEVFLRRHGPIGLGAGLPE